jgi:serine phosphatase RsbU (regulator of sigma subunit)
LKNPSTLFKRLIWSVAIPEFIIFLVVGIFSYMEIKHILDEKGHEQNEYHRKEINGLLDFLDYSIKDIENDLDIDLKLISWNLCELYFSETDSIESTDLLELLAYLKMDPEFEKIDIVDRQGFVVNSSNTEMIGRNVFEIPSLKKTLYQSFDDGRINLEKFTIEGNNGRVLKYSTQATKDGKYLIQLRKESMEISSLSSKVSAIISKMNETRSDLVSFEVFIQMHQPKSLISLITDSVLDINQSAQMIAMFNKGVDTSFIESIDEREIQTEYILSKRPQSNLYEAFVVKLKRDIGVEKELLKSALYQKVSLFLFGILLLFIILLINTNFITRPIKMVSSAARSVGSGHLSKRVPVLGNKELIELAVSFNQMASDLEKSDGKIRQQKAKIEEAHKEIKSSITYAKRIQSAILPPIKLVNQHLFNSFVLYKAKDIVAGDFYWLEVSQNEVLFAAADCTGHGVPGAMVSVVCNNALNRSVREYGLTDPGLILDKTRGMVIQEFGESEEEVMDGMDIALCSLSGNKLRYAGAHNPLWLVRDGVLIETKANKQPIGVYHKLEPFDTHTIDLLPGDSFYIFSDGFADQFGGEKGKKFMSARFKKLILSIQSEPMVEQKELLNKAFEEWRGRREQIDDVCVIGVKI